MVSKNYKESHIEKAQIDIYVFINFIQSCLCITAAMQVGIWINNYIYKQSYI